MAGGVSFLLFTGDSVSALNGEKLYSYVGVWFPGDSVDYRTGDLLCLLTLTLIGLRASQNS